MLFLTLGWFGLQMALALDVTQFQVMLDEKLGNAAWIGLVLCLGPLAGITVQPLVGALSDTLNRRGISRRQLILAGSLVGCLSILAMPMVAGLWGLVGLIALFFVGLNIVIVCYRALVTEVSSRRALLAHKGLISGFVALFSGAGSCAMFALCSVTAGTPWPFWGAVILMLLTMGIFFIWSPRPKPLALVHPDGQKTPEPVMGLWHMAFYAMPFLGLLPAVERRVSHLPYQVPIFRLFVVLYFSWIGIQALRGYFVLYAQKAIGLTHADANSLLAVLTLVMVAASLPLGRLVDRFDSRWVYRLTLAFFALVCLGSFYWVGHKGTAMAMCVLLGLSFSGMVVTPLALLFKLSPTQSEGVYAGLYNLFMSVPQFYSLLITGLLIEYYGSYRIILLVGAVAVTLALAASWRMPIPVKPSMSKSAAQDAAAMAV